MLLSILMSDYRKFTEQEERWVRSFEQVMKRAPGSLFMFVAAGAVTVMTKDENNDRYMVNGGMDQKGPTALISTPMECDGGDW